MPRDTIRIMIELPVSDCLPTDHPARKLTLEVLAHDANADGVTRRKRDAG